MDETLMEGERRDAGRKGVTTREWHRERRKRKWKNIFGEQVGVGILRCVYT